MATYTLAPVPGQTFLSDTGAIVPGGLIWTYLSGTSTPTPTYTVQDGSVPQPNPIVLDGFGRVPSEIYLPPGTIQKWVFETAAPILGGIQTHGAVIRTYPTVAGVPTSTSNQDIQGTAGEALAAGTVAYLSDGSGGKTAGFWYLADADFAYASVFPEVGMVPSSISSLASGTIRLAGSVTGLSALTPGATYYISATAGALTSTAPPNSRKLGVADSTSSLVLKDIPSTTLNLLHGGSGTSTAAGATNVDSVAISGLTALDTLVVEYGLRSVTQATAQPVLYSVTDSGAVTTSLVPPLAATLAAGATTIGTAKIRQLQHSNVALFSLTAAQVPATGSLGGDAVAPTMTTPWTSAWTLALRHNGVTAGGTFQWSWAVYVLRGQ